MLTTPRERRQLRDWMNLVSDQDPRHTFLLALVISVLCIIVFPTIGIAYALYCMWP